MKAKPSRRSSGHWRYRLDVVDGSPRKDVALFIDWENIKYGLLNRENRLPNAQALKEAASRFGRVVTAKAYAN